MNDSRIRTPKKPLPEIPVRREDYENHRLDQYVAVSPPIHPLTEKSKLARLGLKKEMKKLSLKILQSIKNYSDIFNLIMRVKSLSKSPSKSPTKALNSPAKARTLFEKENRKCSDITFQEFTRKEAETALQESI